MEEPTYRYQQGSDTLIIEDEGKDKFHPLENYLFEQVAWPFLDFSYLDLNRKEAEAITSTLVKTAIAPPARIYLEKNFIGVEKEFCDAMVAVCRKLQPTLNDMQRELIGAIPNLLTERIQKELSHAA